MSANELPLVLFDVSMRFGSGEDAVSAVRNVNLEVNAGEILAIVGPSGSGKTTLLSIAGCLLSPTGGRVEILGEDATKASRARRAEIRLRHIGFVFQAYNLLPSLSVRDNVEIALALAGAPSHAARKRTSRILDLLKLSARSRLHPGDLSGGEQQRLAIARALANKPDIILADEPTSSLDSQLGRSAMELMVEAIREEEARSLVVVTHDIRILDLVDRIVLMEDGALRAAESGEIRAT